MKVTTYPTTGEIEMKIDDFRFLEMAYTEMLVGLSKSLAMGQKAVILAGCTDTSNGQAGNAIYDIAEGIVYIDGKLYRHKAQTVAVGSGLNMYWTIERESLSLNEANREIKDSGNLVEVFAEDTVYVRVASEIPEGKYAFGLPRWENLIQDYVNVNASMSRVSLFPTFTHNMIGDFDGLKVIKQGSIIMLIGRVDVSIVPISDQLLGVTPFKPAQELRATAWNERKLHRIEVVVSKNGEIRVTPDDPVNKPFEDGDFIDFNIIYNLA